MQDYIQNLDDNSPRFRHEKWRKIFDEQLESNPLSLSLTSTQLFSLPIGEHDETWETWLPKDKVWNRLDTLSQISVLPEKEKNEVINMFNEAVKASDTSVNEKGDIAIHGTTFSYWTSKIPA